MERVGLKISFSFGKTMEKGYLLRAALCLPSGLSWGQFAELMPRAEDQSSIWWAEGFPEVVESAPWHRVIESSQYAMVLDTQKLTLPHFGALNGKSWGHLPSADLDLSISVNGKFYECQGSEGWSRHGGPRLVEAGRFFQRADVTDLIFQSKDGEKLKVDARFETAAWSDRLGMVFDASPGSVLLKTGEAAFGKVGGGFGLTGENHLSFPEASELDPNSLTWSFWAFVPDEYASTTQASPWLMCLGPHEQKDGNVGIILRGGKAVVTANVGGGRENRIQLTSQSLEFEAWNHFVLSYDGAKLRFFLNGRQAEGGDLGKKREVHSFPMTFGRRGDGNGDGHHFYGVVDEIESFKGVWNPKQLREARRKSRHHYWGFDGKGLASERRPKLRWKNPQFKIRLRSGGKSLEAKSRQGKAAALVLNPRTLKELSSSLELQISAGAHPVKYDHALGWHQIDLDGSKAIGKGNDIIERVPLTLKNLSDKDQVARLMFSKSGRGLRGRLGSAITGISAILCDEQGEPTGIPVQLSKNWHNEYGAGVYKGTWFHGITQLCLPAGREVKLQLVLANAHWGGVAAASHAQLSLIGWGSNQRWEQSALGSWGESLCYEPGQGQGRCMITDVRPLMLSPMNGKGQWGWTNNVGGGDFLKLVDREGRRQFHQGMKTKVFRQGPCLTEVEFSGRIGKGIQHSVKTSLGRTDDLVRGTYRLRMDVSEPVDFSRFVIFQVGADTYNFTREKRFLFGDKNGLKLTHVTEHGGEIYRMKPLSLNGEMPWVSLEAGEPRLGKKLQGAWANRGIIVREWKARLGGRDAGPHFAERGVSQRGSKSSTVDLVPPAGVTRLEAGDFVEAVIEYIVMPQKAEDYYGPNVAFKEALKKHGGSWKMIHREVVGNDRKVDLKVGQLVSVFPDIRVACVADKASYQLKGGLGYLPVTFINLSQHGGYVLKVDGEPVDQAVHGKDFWQTDYDPVSQTWSQVYNLPRGTGENVLIEFGRE